MLAYCSNPNTTSGVPMPPGILPHGRVYPSHGYPRLLCLLIIPIARGPGRSLAVASGTKAAGGLIILQGSHRSQTLNCSLPHPTVFAFHADLSLDASTLFSLTPPMIQSRSDFSISTVRLSWVGIYSARLLFVAELLLLSAIYGSLHVRKAMIHTLAH